MPGTNAGKIPALILLPLAYGFLSHFIFDLPAFSEHFTVISYSFLFLVPVAAGVLTSYLYRVAAFKKKALLWILLFNTTIYFIVAFLSGLDHPICLSIAFFPFLILTLASGSIYSVISAHRGKVLVLTLLLPFLICPIEQLKAPDGQDFYTSSFISLKGNRDSLWRNVMGFRVPDAMLNKKDMFDQVFPKPVEAVFKSWEVGEKREAIFSNGIIFSESIAAVRHGYLLEINIHADPSAIPEDALDKHLVIGGGAFNLVEGKYRLAEITPGHFTLVLSCKYRLKTNINIYASFWAGYIIREIQMSILAAMKERADSI